MRASRWRSALTPWHSYPTITSLSPEAPPFPSFAPAGAKPWWETGEGIQTPEEEAQPASCMRGMIDLAGTSGLPLWLDLEHTRLVLAQPLQPQDEAWLPGVPIGEGGAYWLYPDVALATDVGVLDEFGVRHSLLLLQPRAPGGEYTRINAHALELLNGVRTGEAYGVVYGEATFLLQEQLEGPGPVPAQSAANAVYWIEAQAGDKVMAPAHTEGLAIINTGNQPLVLSNLSAREALPIAIPDEGVENAYQVREHNGRPTVQVEGRNGPQAVLYHSAPTQAPEYGLQKEVPLYSAFVHHPEQFQWLLTGEMTAAHAD